jgi:hypothetical protein
VRMICASPSASFSSVLFSRICNGLHSPGV